MLGTPSLSQMSPSCDLECGDNSRVRDKMLGDIDQNNHCFKLNALWMGEPHLIIADSGPWFRELGHSSNL